ncbi:tyrosine-type recombinase/integrase [Actinoplanes sp. NPDC000266]
MTLRVVQYSGGIGSWATAVRVAERYGASDLVLLAANTKVEDPDLWRFVADSAALLGVNPVVVADGRTPWQVFADERFLGNSRIAPCSVICTAFTSLVMTLSIMIKEFGMDMRVQLMEGRASVPVIGEVSPSCRLVPPFLVLDGLGRDIEPVTAYLRDLTVSDCGHLTVRSYAFGLLRWFRLLWLLEVGWERATEAEVVVLVGWLRSAVNPQRRRSTPGSAPAGSVNTRTGRPTLAAGYAPSTINHALSVVSGFYRFHAHLGQGPVVNPVPVAPQRRRALSHRSPLELQVRHGRARLRQKVPTRLPRAIPDRQWDELFEAVGCDRDRALLEFFVSSGARAAELLGVGIDDIDWAGQRLWVISKGTRARQMVPASPKAFVFLARYLDEAGPPPPGSSLWRTQRGAPKPLAYWALRRIMQRVNARLGTNWSLHDLRHTAATRMANGGKLTLAEVQAILRHADIRTTGRYLATRVEDLAEKLAEHYARPRPAISYSAGYDPADITAVFGG